jgi:hypothetical protein
VLDRLRHAQAELLGLVGGVGMLGHDPVHDPVVQQVEGADPLALGELYYSTIYDLCGRVLDLGDGTAGETTEG